MTTQIRNVLLVMAAACLVSGAQAARAGDSQVSGGGQYVGGFGLTKVTGHAVVKKDGTVTGQFEQHNPDLGLTIHGEVDCVVFLGGNVAVVGGTISRVKKSSPGFEFIQVGRPFALLILDNGEGGHAAPDLVSPYFVGITCEEIALFADPFLEFFSPLSRGNFQVRP